MYTYRQGVSLTKAENNFIFASSYSKQGHRYDVGFKTWELIAAYEDSDTYTLGGATKELTAESTRVFVAGSNVKLNLIDITILAAGGLTQPNLLLESPSNQYYKMIAQSMMDLTVVLLFQNEHAGELTFNFINPNDMTLTHGFGSSTAAVKNYQQFYQLDAVKGQSNFICHLYLDDSNLPRNKIVVINHSDVMNPTVVDISDDLLGDNGKEVFRMLYNEGQLTVHWEETTSDVYHISANRLTPGRYEPTEKICSKGRVLTCHGVDYQGCSECYPNSSGCKTCEVGCAFIPNTDSGSGCFACDSIFDNCQKCTFIEPLPVCEQCKDGFTNNVNRCQGSLKIRIALYLVSLIICFVILI